MDGHTIRNTNRYSTADTLRGGSRKQIVVTDAAGVHVLQLQAGRLARVAFAEQGQRVDGWVIDTASNSMQAVGDLDGNGRAEILVRSPWGMGLLGVDPLDRVQCSAMAAHETLLGDWHFQNSDAVVGAGRLTGSSGRRELLVVKS